MDGAGRPRHIARAAARPQAGARAASTEGWKFMGIASVLGSLSTVQIRLLTALKGEFVAEDALGHRYYRAKAKIAGRPERRWVMYPGTPEASSIPPEWHGWLHHQQKDPPDQSTAKFRQSWQKPPQENLTGTNEAYHPRGHQLEGGRRDRATGDYRAWTPGE
jgi:NADH:ubiquinone oxidoreductase subunit